MKKLLNIILGLALITACNLGDPFEVVNPNLDESIIGTANSARAWLTGVERQMTISTNYWTAPNEIASDNYENTQTFFNQFLDNLTFNFVDNDINLVHRGIARLREMALFGLNEVGPADAGYTDEIRSQYLFYAGVSHMWAADLYQEVPSEPQGPLVSRVQHTNLAVEYFTQALDADPSNVAALMGRARSHYRAGRKAEAVADAQAVLAADPMHLKNVLFDPINSDGTNAGFNYTINNLQLALFDRGGFDDLQPLPRLDFLDPKLYAISATVSSPIALTKAEEAHFIIAEAQLSDGDVGGARQTLKNLIDLVAERPTATFDDSQEDRSQREPGSRPDTSAVIVDGREGLVLDRKDGFITVPIVSGTSITHDMLDAISDEVDMLEMLYLMRQEVFIAEGRRFSDMGLTYIMSENEILLNDNVGMGSATPDIPPFINAVRNQLDDFEYDAETLVATITVNVNRIIAENRTSPYVCPFH